MSRNPKRIPVQVLNPPPNCRSITSLAHARRYVKRGLAEMIDGKLSFFPKGHRLRVEVIEAYATVCDSGFNGFLRYPMPLHGAAERFPALSRAGAGL